jgi:hypothetical protein
MRSCLFASDYGPPDPAFDPRADAGRLIKGFEAHSAQLVRATNLGQLLAMERKLARGEAFTWCDQGYGWTNSTATDALFAGILAFVILPWALWRLRLWPRQRNRRDAFSQVS